MKTNNRVIFFFLSSLILCVSLILTAVSCGEPATNNKDTIVAQQNSVWLNHNDTVAYVGKQTCRQCHADIYNSFIETGMGKSIGPATREKSSGTFEHAVIYDKALDFYYHTFWQNDSMRILEFRIKGKDTIHKRIETVDFIIGSGQHTNSHLQMVNGYVNQMPMTFYSQKKKWDLPPGFENGKNSRFARIIGLECMSCHNAFADFEQGSENKFTSIPNGIDCERCHGPGEIHVAQKSNGKLIDTAKAIDYSIVNPAKLPVDRQFDVCMRCHLQGNAVLKEDKSWYSFKPGMILSDHISVFLARYKNADEEFIMASHADRLKQSQCFIVSSKNATHQQNALRPYKDALTCVTCHNPHVSVKKSPAEKFNQICNNCHSLQNKGLCTEKESVQKKVAFNCISCHMPQSGSTDIPHVQIHDHYIRKPVSEKELKGIKEFVGLLSVNDKNPDKLTRAKAFINQFEKFEADPMFLDSASKLLTSNTSEEKDKNFELLVQLNFMRRNYSEIISLCKSFSSDYLLKKRLCTPQLSNTNAWTCYRIGEAFMETKDLVSAELYFEQCCKLAPLVPSFLNKLATAQAMNGKSAAARASYLKVLIENPKFIPAMTNLGYLYASEGNFNEAEVLYERANKLDPEDLPLQLNRAGLFFAKKQEESALQILFALIKKNPEEERAVMAVLSLASIKRREGNLKSADNLITSLRKYVGKAEKSKKLIEQFK